MKRTFYLLLFLTYGQGRLFAGYVVDLEASSEMKALFDGGLRPIHRNGLEMSDLELPGPSEVSFRLGGITTPQLLAEWSFRIYYDKGLSNIMGYSRQPLTRDQAYNELSKWETALGFPESLPAIRKWFDDYPKGAGPDLLGRKVFRNVPGASRYVSYYLRHSFQEEKPFLMTVQISWNIKGPQPIIFGKEPLKPPAGYEDHDMRSLEKRGADERMKQWNAQQAALKVAPPLTSSKTKSPSTEPLAVEQNWWKWVLGIAALAWLGRMIWKQWRDSHL